MYSIKEKKKLYYSISEVAELTGLEQHVIRYWESEFGKLKPKKNRAGNRQFREKDIKIIRYIKHLLQNEMYTVQGAKKKLLDSGYKEVEGQLDLLTALQPTQSTPLTPVSPVSPQQSTIPISQPQSSSSASSPSTEKTSESSSVPPQDGAKTKDFLKEIKTELQSIKSLLL